MEELDFESDFDLNHPTWQELYEDSLRFRPVSNVRPSPVGDALPYRVGGQSSDLTWTAYRMMAHSALRDPAYQGLPKDDLSWIRGVFSGSSPKFRQAVAEVLQPIPPVDYPESDEDFPTWPANQEQLARMTPQQVQDQCEQYDKGGLRKLADLLAFRAVLAAAYDPRRTLPDKKAMFEQLRHFVEDAREECPDPLRDFIAYLDMPSEELNAQTRRWIMGQKRSETISSACDYLRAINDDAAAAELEAEFVVARTAMPEECKWLDTAECKEELPRWPADRQRLERMKPELVEAMCTLFDRDSKRALADWLALNASLAAAYAADKTMEDRTDMFNRLSAFLEDSDEPWPLELRWFDAYVQYTESVEDQDVQARCSTLGAKDPEAIADVCRYLRSIDNYAEAARVAAEALIGVVWANSSTRLLTMWESTKGSLLDEPWPEDLTSMRQTFIDRLRAAGAFQAWLEPTRVEQVFLAGRLLRIDSNLV